MDLNQMHGANMVKHRCRNCAPSYEEDVRVIDEDRLAEILK